MFGNAALQLIGVFTAVLAARLFSPSARGELAAAVAVLLVSAAVSDFGISQAVPYLTARQEPGVGATSVVMALIIAAVASPLIVAGIGAFGLRLSMAGMTYVVVSVPTLNIISNTGALFQGSSRHGIFTVYRIGIALPYVVGLAVTALGAERTADRVLWTTTGVECLVCILAVVYAMRLGILGSPGIAQARRLASYGVRTYMGNMAFSWNRQWPILMVEKLLGSAAAGYFVVAQSYAVVPFAVASAFALLAPGRIANHRGAKATFEGRRLSRIGVASTWLVALALLPMTQLVIPLVYGQRYEPSIRTAMVLVLASALLGTNFIWSSCLRALGLPSIPSIGEIAGLATTLLMTTLLVTELGEFGAAWAALASSAVVALILAAFVRSSYRRAS